MAVILLSIDWRCEITYFELLWRKIEVKFLGKKYCSMTSRHGHDFEYTHGNNKPSWERLVFFKCTVCGKKSYVDFTGQLIAYDL